MPASISGIAVAAWTDAPADVAGWEKLVAGIQFEEAPMKPVPGKKPASGAVVVEADGRVWVVSPSNQFGGYINTFPKGKVDTGLSLRATAIKEAFEESGLLVELTGFLCDSIRSTSVTRYYSARRLGGSPADMGWESQAVHLVPMAMLAAFASHPNDQPVINALQIQGRN
jgi:ADP-ribose pyrophosphatase YjhB (NUDIX family)